MDANTVLVKLNDEGAIDLLHELERENRITVLEENIVVPKPKLSQKYRGIISKEEGEDLQRHITQMRSEWNDI